MISEYPDISNLPNNVIINIVPISNIYRRAKFICDNSLNNYIDFEYLLTNIIETVLISREVDDNLLELFNQYSIEIDSEHETEFFVLSEFMESLGHYLNNQLKLLMLYALDDVAYYRLTSTLSDTLLLFSKVTPEDFYSNLNLGSR